MDCARWVGDCVLSKSTTNEAILWKPCPQRRNDAVTILKRYDIPDANIWFIRLDVDSQASYLCCVVANGVHVTVILFVCTGMFNNVQHSRLRNSSAATLKGAFFSTILTLVSWSRTLTSDCAKQLYVKSRSTLQGGDSSACAAMARCGNGSLREIRNQNSFFASRLGSSSLLVDWAATKAIDTVIL